MKYFEFFVDNLFKNRIFKLSIIWIPAIILILLLLYVTFIYMNLPSTESIPTNNTSDTPVIPQTVCVSQVVNVNIVLNNNIKYVLTIYNDKGQIVDSGLIDGISSHYLNVDSTYIFYGKSLDPDYDDFQETIKIGCVTNQSYTINITQISKIIVADYNMEKYFKQ